MDSRTLRYAVLLGDKYGLHVESAVILLRPEADRPRVKGHVRRRRQGGYSFLDFGYIVIRLWELPVEAVLQGPVGILPLAPLTSIAQEALPEVIRQMEARIT